ncbi:protealysin inhibitor emfourin [Naasia aerilata]|uniref:Uncharacterized protein n=1 Tax=Naasia aerilata TaxID=1162966 RepID=A0ABN6XRA3_9MICO|nr:protealysin inhibitor emfourin [Naasia aerilata]BDZ47391.1 hypothetical protein GCM10025866_33000 [Naasia aerilata]
MIVVTVSRSGGIAGITRRWTVSLPEDDWEELWERRQQLGTDPTSRDRFVYRVADGRRSVVIAESLLDDHLRAMILQQKHS